MADIRPKDLPPAITVLNSAALIVDNGVTVDRASPAQIVDAAIPLASQSEAEAGLDNTKRMTPLRVAQYLSGQVGGGSLPAALGGKANASALGVSGSAENMGSFSGSIIDDNQTAKQAIQLLENFLMMLISGEVSFDLPDEADGDEIPAAGSGYLYLSGGVMKVA